MAVTLKDVAILAQVSPGTVSRVLGNPSYAQKMLPETRQRVIAAAEKLNYRRNQFAAAMRTGVNATVAIINSEDFAIGHSMSGARVLYGILESASASNFALKTYTDGDMVRCVNEIVSSQIKYVISMSPRSAKREETVFLCRQNGLKLVFAYETSHGEYPAVATDNYNGAREAVRYLVSMCHRRIALVCGDYQFWHYIAEKYNGYLSGLKESGINPDFDLMICETDIQPRIEELLDRPAATRPTAFFCAGDGMAMQVQRAAAQRGLRLPDDVSVTGFGCTEEGLYTFAPLTSVDEKYEEIGKTAFRLLVDGKIDLPQDSTGTYRVPPELVFRESVAKLC